MQSSFGLILAATNVVLTALLGGLAAWIATQNMLAAKLKAESDLFQRRNEVFIATEDYLFLCTSASRPGNEGFGAFYRAQRPARFLFDKSINEFIQEILRLGLHLNLLYERIENIAQGSTPHETYIEERFEIQTRLHEYLDGLTERFQKAMNLSQVRPFSLKAQVPPWLRGNNAEG